MRRTKFMAILLLTFLVSGIAANCTGSFSSNTITIAVVDEVAATSGNVDPQSIYAGAKLAVDSFNDHNNGFKVNLDSYGDAADAKTAEATAGKVVSSKAVAVIGHSSSEATGAAIPVYDQAGLPLVIVNPVQAALTDQFDHAFRVNYSAEDEAVYLATYLNKVQNQSRASVVFSNDQYGLALKTQFTNTFRGLGGEIIYTASTAERTADDIANDFVIAREGDPGTVFIAADPATAVNVLVAMKRKGVTYPLVGASTLTRADFVRNLSRQNEGVAYFVDGILTTNTIIFDSTDRYASQFLSTYRSAYNKSDTESLTPDDQVINGYNAALVLLTALKREYDAGQTDVNRGSLHDELARMETPETGTQGITGPIHFDLLHNVSRAPRFGVYQNGEIVSAMVQFDPIPSLEQFSKAELRDQVNKGRITTVNGTYVYQSNIIYAGVDIIEIQDVDIKTSTYKMDFYMWVRYRANSKDDKFLPADIVFSNADEPPAMELVRPIETDMRTNITTETYRVTGTFKNQFLFYDYPYDQQKLIIQFRNKNATTSFIQYVVDRIGMRDTGGDSLREHFKDNGAYEALFGWNVRNAFAEQSIFATMSTLGDPQNFERNTSAEFSLINVGILVQRASFQFIIKSLLPLLFTLILAYITFFLPLGHSERLGVGSTALLTTAFFHLNLASSLPEIGYTVAMEYFFYAAYIISALIVLLETISIRTEKRSESETDEAVREQLQKQRENLNMTGRIVYPLILLATIAGGFAIQFDIIHLDPNKEVPNSLVEKITESTRPTTDGNAQLSNEQTNTLRLSTWRPEDTEQMQQLLQAFQKKNPNITIQYEAVMGANYDTILARQLQAGNGPDLFFVRPYDVRIRQYLMALPHDDLPVQETKLFDESKSDPWKGSDGRYYALPYVGVVQGIYYNKDFFTANPEIPSPDTWKTWNDLLTYSQRIEETGRIPFANVLNTSNDSEMFQSILVNFVGGPEGRAKYSEASASNQCFNSYEMVRAFNAIAQVSPFTLNATLTPEETAKLTNDAISKQYFLDQKAVMLFGGSWDLQYFTDNAKFDWSVFAPPAPIGSERYVIFQPDIGIGINNASPRKQEAITFLKWLMTDGVKETEKYLPGRYLLINSATGQTTPTTDLVHAADFAELTNYPSDIRWMFTDVDGQYPRSSEIIKDALYRMVTPDSSGAYLSPNEAANLLQKGLGEWYLPAQTCK